MTQLQSQSAYHDVFLVGFQDQDNLGLRYLISSLEASGVKTRLVTYHADPVQLLELAKAERPVVIGFSLIFQYMAPDFARVIATLRENGVDAHLTMGGHYPSFDYGEVLERMPGLDSVVRFEGELTLCELVNRVRAGEDWRQVEGIAYRLNNKIVANPLRAPVANLDTLPVPNRDDIQYETQPFPTASILGSRGCPWDCSFCSIRPFYEMQGGSLRRLRKPEALVQEMSALFFQRGVSLFLFQDDDFLAGGRVARRWAFNIADAIEQAGLADKIAFKISCRSDEVNVDVLSRLMQVGLTHVYMGVESGDEQGLLNMNKRILPEQHLKAGRLLKQLGLTFDFGFMLMDPYTTFESIRNNINFLDGFVGDGWAVAGFCRMLPYAGTPTKQRLEGEGRLRGTPFEPDYHFLDPKLDLFYDWMLETFHERNFTNRGLVHILRSLLFEAHLRIPGFGEFDPGARRHLHYLAAVCNGIAAYTLRAAVAHCESKSIEELERDRSFLRQLTQFEKEEEQKLLRQVVALYWPILQKKQASRSVQSSADLVGGFENSWTLAQRSS